MLLEQLQEVFENELFRNAVPFANFEHFRKTCHKGFHQSGRLHRLIHYQVIQQRESTSIHCDLVNFVWMHQSILQIIVKHLTDVIIAVPLNICHHCRFIIEKVD